MIYYVKQGQSSILRGIKILNEECMITSNIYSMNERKIEKIVKKMSKKGIKQLVLSKELKKQEKLIKKLNSYDITIFDGKWLMQYLLENIILYLKRKNKVSDLNEITILANDLTDEVKQNIRNFASTYKKIRIVTNHLERFKRLEKELYEENGTVIILTNNKKKALANSIIIINFDFVQEMFDQYSVNEKAIIINLTEKIKVNKKRFSGSIITDYEVEFLDTEEIITKSWKIRNLIEKQEEFCLKEMLEEKIYTDIIKQPIFNTFTNVQENIKKHKIEIKMLFGINGEIS